MKVIIPILITAIWTCATVRIDGVWPPPQAVQSFAEVGEQLEAPAQTFLDQLAGDHDSLEPHGSLLPQRRMKGQTGRLGRIALPRLPKAPSEPVCG